MDIKRTSVHDIYQSISKGQDPQDIYKRLNDILGESNPFAKFSIGSGFYVWSHPSGDWQSLADASSVEQEMVNNAILSLRRQIAEKVGEKTADAIFTVPDDSYIFYNNDGGNIKLLYTGWGFKKPVRTTSGPEIGTVEKRMPVDICFVYDGERLQNYEFGLYLPKQLKQMQTNGEGLYHFNNLKVGESYKLKDLKSGRDLTLLVEDGKSLYEFDVTSYTSIDVQATLDGEPIVGEQLSIDYKGQTHTLTTDESGRASLQVALHEGTPFSASMREQRQDANIAPSGNEVLFAFESERPPLPPEIDEPDDPTPPSFPPPALFSPHIHIVGDNGFIGTRYPISVEYHGTVTNYVSDDNGMVYLPQMESGQQMRVTDGLNPDNVADYTLDANQEEYIFHVPYTLNDENRDIKVMCRDKDDKPIRCNYIRFVQETPNGRNERLFAPDAQGNVYFSKEAFAVGPEIEATFIGADKEYDPIKFALEENESEYLLKERGEGGWWYIVVEILAVIGTAAGAFFAWPYLMEFFNDVANLL